MGKAVRRIAMVVAAVGILVVTVALSFSVAGGRYGIERDGREVASIPQ